MKVGLIHAVESAKAATSPRLQAAGFTVINLLDEALLPMAERRGGVDEACRQRMAALIQLAVEAEADVVIVTCNAYSGAVAEIAKALAGPPVLSIDAELVRQAILTGSRIGVIGTVEVGLQRQQQAFREAAERMHRQVDITPHLVEDALEFVRSGDLAAHDLAIAEAAEAFTEVDVIVLAQASMAGAADLIAERGRLAVPVLASPQLLVDFLREGRPRVG